jgi:hypothetical protein
VIYPQGVFRAAVVSITLLVGELHHVDMVSMDRVPVFTPIVNCARFPIYNLISWVNLRVKCLQICDIYPLSIQHGQFFHKREDPHCPPIQNLAETIFDSIQHLRFPLNVMDQAGISDVHVLHRLYNKCNGPGKRVRATTSMRSAQEDYVSGSQ